MKLRFTPGPAALAAAWLASCVPSLGAEAAVSHAIADDALRAHLRIEAETAARALRADSLRRALVDSARLGPDAPDCLAYDPAAAECLVRAPEFNASLERTAIAVPEPPVGYPGPGDVARERSAVLSRLLEPRFPAFRALPARVRDSLEGVFRARREMWLEEARARIGDSALAEEWRRAPVARFDGRREARYEVIASSDSVLADSLRHCVAEAGGTWPRAAGLTWDRMPPVAADGAWELRDSGWAGPFRLPGMWMHARARGRQLSEASAYGKAWPLLAARIELARGTPAGQARAAARETGASVRIWLAPGPIGGKRFDTAAFAGRDAATWELPDAVRDAIGGRPPGPGETLGPIRTPYGMAFLSGRSAAEAVAQSALSGGPDDPYAMAESETRSRDEDAWRVIVEAYLDRQGAGALESAREAWMRRDLRVPLPGWAEAAPP